MRDASDQGRAYDSGMGNAERQFAAPEGIAQQVEKLYTAHARLVRSICRSLLRDRDEAEDAVQQTFLSAQRALANGSSPREPAAWLAVIARNECLARVRERMREPLPVDEELAHAGPDAHSAAVSRYEVATLREALADLPRAQREAILLRELRGLSYDEVARALSLTTGAVESLIFRARRTLQVKLNRALTALSPVPWLGRLLGGGGTVASAPVVAKVAAVSIGAAILAGGAAVDPHAFGLGHGAPKAVKAATTHHHRTAPVVASSHKPIWSGVVPSPPAAAHPTERDVSARETESSNTGDTSSSDTSSSDRSGSDKSSSGGAGGETDDTGTTTTVPTTTTTTTSTPAPPPATGGSDDSGEPDDNSGD